MSRGKKHDLVWWRNTNRVADIFVMIAMTLVAVAIGLCLNLQFGFTQWLSALAALGIFGGLLALHAAVRRADEVDVLHAEIWRLETAIARSQGVAADAVLSPKGPPLARGPAQQMPRPPQAQQQPRDPRAPGPGGPTPQAAGRLPAPAPNSLPPQPAVARGPAPAPRTGAPPVVRPATPADLRARPRSAAEAIAAAPGPAAPPGQMPATAGPAPAVAPRTRPGAHPDEVYFYGAFDQQSVRTDAVAAAARPATPPGAPTYARAAAPDRAQQDRPQPERAPSPRDADVAMIQALIKKLADEVNGVTAAAAGSPVATEAEHGAIEASLAALRSTADVMRSSEPPRRPLGASAQASVEPPPVNPGHTRIATLAEAITAGRIEVFLEPILALADQRTRHYEVAVRLRGRAGELLPPPESISEISGTGLLPLLDAARLSPAAQMGRRFAEKGRQGALFSSVSGESLASQQFLADFAAAYREREGLAGQLVMTFAQSDVRSFAPRDWQTVLDMRNLGFRFALQAVTDLDMDFEALKSAGFDFVKLDAQVFLEGMPLARGFIPASDICRHLAALGLTLIVGSITDEAQLARIFGFGVLFGQGQLFGGPRPVKVQVEARASHAAA